MRDLTQRREAASRGETRYYTGRPCSRGHTAERYVANGACVECSRQRDQEQYRELQELRQNAEVGDA